MPKASRPSRKRDAAADIVSRALIAAGFSEAERKAIGPARRIFGDEAANGLRRLYLQNLRGRSLKGVRLGCFDGPLLLFRAKEQPAPDLPADLGWAHTARTFAPLLWMATTTAYWAQTTSPPMPSGYGRSWRPKLTNRCFSTIADIP